MGISTNNKSDSSNSSLSLSQNCSMSRGIARRLFPLAVGVLCSSRLWLGSSRTDRATSLRRTSRRAAGEEAPRGEDEEVEKVATPEGDWRAFRARLVQQESGVQDEKDKWESWTAIFSTTCHKQQERDQKLEIRKCWGSVAWQKGHP